jgi:hypothetical protein
MFTEETFYRPPELARTARSLPAETYNLAHLQLAQAPGDSVFVPIRSMQYLAVMDAEEIIFVHREGRREIEIAWQHFHPGRRQSLDEPVPYEFVSYHPHAAATMLRLQGEFPRALRELAAKQLPPGAARVIKLDRGR